MSPIRNDDKATGSGMERSKQNDLPFLVVKGLPTSHTEKTLNDLCSSFGKVQWVNRHGNIFFVRFPTIGDLEAVHRALNQTNYGLTITVGDNNRKKNQASVAPAGDPPARQNLYNKGSPKPQDSLEHNAHSNDRTGRKQRIAEKDHGEFRTGKTATGKPFDFVKEVNNLSLATYKKQVGDSAHTISDRVKVKKCATCGKLTAQKCVKCLEPYCSVACQKAAWPQHRFVCCVPSYILTTMPANAEFIAKAKANDITDVTGNMPRNSSLVKITFVNAPNFVFIRSNMCADREEFDKIMSKIQERGNEYASLVNAPSLGQLILTKYNGRYNRGIVLKAEDDNKFKVNLMDYGNTEYRKLSELFEAPQGYRLLARQSTPVYLKGVPNCNMTEQTRDFMNSQIEEIDFRVYYSAEDLLKGKGIYNVELIFARTNKSFNQAIIERSHPNPVDDFYFFNEITQKLPAGGENLELKVMDNSCLKAGLITCALLEHAEEIEKLQRELQRYVESVEDKEYTPRVNEVCICQYQVDKQWYRCNCLELPSDGFPPVRFLDYGHLDFVSIKNIRPYPKDLTFPLYSMECEIAGLPDSCGGELLEKLQNQLPVGGTITCDRAEFNKEDNYFTLTLNAVLAELQADGLLEK